MMVVGTDEMGDAKATTTDEAKRVHDGWGMDDACLPDGTTKVPVVLQRDDE